MLTICTILFVHGLVGLNISPSTLMGIKFGAMDPSTLISWTVPSSGISGLLSNVFVANSPQLILSLIYFTYNGLFTCYIMSAEWNSYAGERKGLRVSGEAVGDQRASLFLQLPYVWGVPLMILSAILHWLCSQSLFVVSLEFDHMVAQTPDSNGHLVCWSTINDSPYGFSDNCYERYVTCGYSLQAILATILLGIVMIVFAVAMSFKRYQFPVMPVVRSCSAAISAACHIPQEEDVTNSSEENVEDQHIKPWIMKLQWGESSMPLLRERHTHVSKEGTYDPSLNAFESIGNDSLSNCSFSHREVTLPHVVLQ